VLTPDSEWFFPAFVVFWLAICGTLSLLGGWHELAERFKTGEAVEGERFRFRSGAIGWRAFPVSYGGCLFASVGPKAFRLSILFPFRFLHPPLVIPWAEVERCEPTKLWFMKYVAVYVKDFGRCLMFDGSLGQKMLDMWMQIHKAS
jgi:hypothetical protein